MMNQLIAYHPINIACLTLDVARSSYQHYLNRSEPLSFQKELEDNLIRNKLEKLINKRASSKYGYRMMSRQPRRDGFRINGCFVNHKRILRVMRENSLLYEIKKSFISTTDSDHNLKKYGNLLKSEQIRITRSDQLRVSDITYIKLPEGFVYLSVIIDAFTRKVIWLLLKQKH